MQTALGKTVTIERSVKTPGTARVTPSEPEVLEILRQVQEHPEIMLSRRELMRYVLATPGKRAEEIQALLHLDHVEQVRLAFQKIANSAEKQLAPLNTSVETAADNLLRALTISELTAENLISAANTHRDHRKFLHGRDQSHRSRSLPILRQCLGHRRA